MVSENLKSDQSWLQLIKEQRMLSALVTLIILMGITAYISPTFLTSRNLTNIFRQSVALGIVSLGQTFVLLSGGFDLSVGSTISIVSVLAALAMGAAIAGVWVVVVILLLLAILIGVVNSLLITRLHLHPFIATFGTLTIIQGITFVLTTKPVTGVTSAFRSFAKSSIGIIPVGFVLFMLMALAAYILLRYTRFGRSVYAIGGDSEVARLAGISISGVLMVVYGISGLTAGVSGLFLTSRLGVGSPIVGTTFAFDSITAVVLGGTSLSGGRGSIIGTVVGVFLLIMVNNGLNLMHVESYWQYIIKAIILVLAVALQRD